MVKVPDARPDRLAFQGFFLPTAVVDAQGPRSVFPDAYDPQMFLNVWSGAPVPETGKPENVYSLDTAGLTQLRNEKGDIVRLRLSPGQGIDLPDGMGSISFDGWSRWVKLQVGDSPGAPVALAAIAFAVAGLCLSLFVRPRRVWVRVAGGTTSAPDDGPDGDDAADDGPRVIEVGGLDRADARGGLTDDVDDLAATLAGAPEVKVREKSGAST